MTLLGVGHQHALQRPVAHALEGVCGMRGVPGGQVLEKLRERKDIGVLGIAKLPNPCLDLAVSSNLYVMHPSGF